MLTKLEKFNEAYGKLKWSVWFWFLVIIIPISFLLTAYDGIRLLLGIVSPADYQRAVENVAIRGVAVAVLTPIWYFGMYRPRVRGKK
jgi:hypothetical protein